MCHHDAYPPMKIVAFDHVSPLPETLNEKKFIIVAVDHFSRSVDGKPVKNQLAERFVRYSASLCGKFGVPKLMFADNARQFDNNCMSAIREQFGTQHQTSPAGYSKGNSICE